MLDIIKLSLIFIIIFIVLKIKENLALSISAGIILAIFIFEISFYDSVGLIMKGTINEETIELVLAIVGTMIMQNMMNIVQKKKNYHIHELFTNKRSSMMLTPFFVGLLPSPTAVLMAAPITEELSKNNLTNQQQAFVTSFYRHISEAFLPTYSYILLAVQLAPITMSQFQIFMIPVIILLFLIPKLLYVNKIKNEKNKHNDSPKIEGVQKLWKYFWPIIMLVIIILIFDVPIFIGVIPIMLLYGMINKLNYQEYINTIKEALQMKIIILTIVTMILKEILIYTGIFNNLSSYIHQLPLHPITIFVLIFLLGGIIIGSQATVAIGIPLAFATFPDGGIALFIFLIVVLFIASQMTPTHLCLGIAADYFHISFSQLLKETMKTSILILCAIIPYVLFIYYFIS